VTPDEILRFWFGDRCETEEEISALVEKCFSVNPDLDGEIRERFGDAPERAIAGEFDAWRDETRAAVALVIVLDQFPRNLFRASPQAFAFDARALEIAKQWVDDGNAQGAAPIEACFMYLPFEHAESLEDQRRCMSLYEELARRVPPELRERFDGFTDYARRHETIIERFGRFPHRNELLGRASTPDEVRYLEDGGDTFG
jgi:uncharacterized protein (DUF924 family)